jgi:hypothetical protein
MGIAIAAFHWSAAEFWSSTPHEFFAAYEQWLQLLKLQRPNL